MGDAPNDPLDLPELIRVTPDEVARAVPPPPRIGVPLPAPAPPAPRTSRLAIASLVFGIMGVPLTCLFGVLAIVSGALALGATHADGSLRGRRLGIVGLLLGLISTVGWSGVLWYNLQNASAARKDKPAPMLDVAGGPPEEIRLAPEPFRTSLLANVVVMGRQGGADWSGSGIVIDREGLTLRVLTNRHVAEAPSGGAATVQVLLSTGETKEGSVIWKAPGGIDLCVVELKALTAADVTVVALKEATAGISQEVYAVGNPLQYRWSLTKGSISSVRTVDMGGERVKIYQTQTPISQGNSGGGLYLSDGRLVGVTTWSVDKSIADGLSFAISIDSLLDGLSRSGTAWAQRILGKRP